MTVPATGMIHSITFIGRSNEQHVQNTIHYRMTAAWDTADINGFYNNIQGVIDVAGSLDGVTPYVGCLCEQYTLTAIRHQIIYPSRFRGKTFTMNVAGARPGTDKAQNVSAVITKQCELAGRSKVGSVHLGGLSSTDYDNGLLNTGLKTAIAAFQAWMILPLFQDFGSGMSSPIIYHPGPNANPKFDLLTGLVLQDTLRTNRSRNVGKGI